MRREAFLRETAFGPKSLQCVDDVFSSHRRSRHAREPNGALRKQPRLIVRGSIARVRLDRGQRLCATWQFWQFAGLRELERVIRHRQLHRTDELDSSIRVLFLDGNHDIVRACAGHIDERAEIARRNRDLAMPKPTAPPHANARERADRDAHFTHRLGGTIRVHAYTADTCHRASDHELKHKRIAFDAHEAFAQLVRRGNPRRATNLRVFFRETERQHSQPDSCDAMNYMIALERVPGPIVYGVEALARYEKAAGAYDILARCYRNAVASEQRRIDGERQFVRVELRRLLTRYAARLRDNGVPPDQMIATVKAVVRQALVRVGWKGAGAFVLELLDWGLEGYYAEPVREAACT